MAFFGLFERVDTVEEEIRYHDIPVEPDIPEVEVEVSDEARKADIDALYAELGIADKERSVYVIGNIMAGLPSEMLEDTLRKTVCAMLATFKLPVEEAVADGQNRISLLNGAKSSVIGNCDEKISAANAEIEKRKREIEELNGTVADLNREKTAFTNMVDTEISSIDKLITFIGG